MRRRVHRDPVDASDADDDRQVAMPCRAPRNDRQLCLPIAGVAPPVKRARREPRVRRIVVRDDEAK